MSNVHRPPILLALIAIAIASASCGGDDDDDGDSGAEPSSATADVEIESCAPGDSGDLEVMLVVTNSLPGNADYVITVGVQDAAGDDIGTALASEQGVPPGEPTQLEAFTTMSGDPAAAECVIDEVERFESE